ncbi:MAG TPA: CmcJ/NvfI family oxidoreductase [Candidatus Binataceae bacterium]|nr:CmcJ/NvfI family oxidoreductase [Candidatus Binataceae bacterium]
MSIETTDQPQYLQAPVNYLENTGERPVTYLCEPPKGVPVRSGRATKHTMAVRDGRPVLKELTLDAQGFELVRHQTRVSNFYNPQEVRAVYYPEVERLVKEATAAVKVLVFDHNVRCRPMAERGENGAREPVKYAHNDYTVKSGPQRVRDLLPDEADKLLKNRFAVINVWRPIRGPVQESPLAVCDAESMKIDDFIATDLKYSDRVGEVYSVAFNPNHRWFYFPQMEPEEALLLKCYDSAQDGRARFTAHTAIEDPTSRADAPARESIEVRTLVFFPPVS